MRRSTAIAILGLGIVSVIAMSFALGTAMAETPRYTIDANHDLTSESAIEAYESTGVARANVTTPHLSMAVASSSEQCGVETSLFSNARNDYFCIEYHGDVPQTTRVYLPDGYWEPYVSENVSPVNDGPAASMQPTEDQNYTAVTIDFDTGERAVYPIPRDVTTSYSLINSINERTETVVGIKLWSGGTEWRHINRSAFDHSPAVAVETLADRTIVEYDATPEKPSATWLPVPSGPSATSPVYQTTRTVDGNETVYVISQTESGAHIRYRARGTGIARVDAAFEEISSIDDKISVALNDWLPEWLGGSS